jgi:hypothetical protein
MLINGKRALAYTAIVSEVVPIKGADNIELIKVNGWNVISKKGELDVGNTCVFFEIDSKLPEAAWSEFLRTKNFKVKTMKLSKFGVISQGLALPLKHFDRMGIPNENGVDVTDLLGVTYIEDEDNIRKAEPKKKSKNFLMRFSWYRKLFRGSWDYSFPSFVKKTDEERIENMPNLLNDDETLYVVTEKLDGTSCTYAMERKLFGYKFYVCSRNRCIPKSDKQNGGIYWELAKKYNIKRLLKEMLERSPEAKYIYIQGEGVGNIQGNPLKLKENDLYIFNLVTDKYGKLDGVSGSLWAKTYGLKWVPVVCITTLPSTMEEMKEIADGISFVNHEVKREGLVFRTLDSSVSFKNVSREYLLSKKGK